MKWLLMAVCVVLGAAAFGEERSVPIGVAVGGFFPTDSEVRDNFGDSWFRVGVGLLHIPRPDRWDWSFDAAYYVRDSGDNRVGLLPVTLGVSRTLGGGPATRPYVAVHAGAYRADVRAASLGVDDEGWGFAANAAVGVTFDDTWFVEGRYNYFSEFQGLDFSGFELLVGAKLLDLRF